jgi:transcriptional regulator with XRE-family HTH domain
MRTFPSPARQQLMTWLSAPDRSQEKLADLLEIGQSTVSLWTREHTRPEYHHRVLLQMICGIPVDDWMTADERAKISRITHSLKELASTGTEG